MRQIVRNQRRIVQSDALHARRLAAANGRATVTVWAGAPLHHNWALGAAIGFLLPVLEPIEATCAAGVCNQIAPGEMLIINRGQAEHFGLTLARKTTTQAATALANIGTTTAASAVMGHLQLNKDVQDFVSTPTRAMAVVKLSAREHERLISLALLLAAEAAEEKAAEANGVEVAELTATQTLQTHSPTHPHPARQHLDRALYASLTEVLCSCDPLGTPALLDLADPRLARALRAMIANPALPWRLETMARAAALSRTLFATRFRAQLGITPLNYLTMLRLQLAATLRAESPQHTAYDIAKAVGYADESALRRAQQRATL